MRLWFRSSILIGAVILVGSVSGCHDKPPADPPTSPTTPTTPVIPPSNPTASSAAPFSLSIYTQYDGATYQNFIKFAETGTTTCAAAVGTPVINCSIAVDEGRLYYSSLNMVFSWNATQCSLLTFEPYYYQTSVSNSYLAPGATTPIDCSGLPTPSTCYAGAAPELVTGFPSFTSLIYFPDETSGITPTQSVKISSGYSKKSNSNRHVANDLDPTKIGNAYTSLQLGSIGDGLVAGSYVNYRFSCRDTDYDPETYIINLNVTDIDSAAGSPVADDFLTWKLAP